MQSNIKCIFQIQNFLKGINYPDYQRISNEIYEYLVKNTYIKKEDIFKRLESNEPWEYIKGSTLFCGSEFLVTKDTLIPRIETEQLVYESVEYIKQNSIRSVVDVGTGSGCIAISIAKLLEKNTPYSIYAIDISHSALSIAKRNENIILEKQLIKWVHTDLITDLELLKEPTLIVANLPYIPTKQYEGLDESVREYEPRLALDGGTKGLSLYKRLFTQIKSKGIDLKALHIETEESMYKETVSLLEENFKGRTIEKVKDCFNRDRFLVVK